MLSRCSIWLILFLFVASSCTQQGKKGRLVRVERNGTEIKYSHCGTADTTLLFIHGWCINKGYWELQKIRYCSRFTVVAIDLPGFGESGKSRTNWTFDEYANDVEAVIDQLKLKNVILIGHSMSGDILLKASNNYPGKITGIIGIDNLHEPGSPMNQEQQEATNQFFDQLGTSFDSAVTKYMKPSLFQPSTPPGIVDRVMQDVYDADPAIATAVLRGLTEVSQQEKGLMQGLHHRLFLVNSDVVPANKDSLNKYCRYGAEVFTVHATGHYPMIEKPAEFNSALEKALHLISKDVKQ